MATIKGREDQCGRAYASLLRQPLVDHIFIQSKPHGAREDDARKFLNEPISGYMITADDDLIYPVGYVEYMVNQLDEQRKINGPCAVTLMGRLITGKMTSYYHDLENAVKLDWRDADGITKRIHIPGTCMFIYHTDDIRFTMDDFPTENMADIHAGIKCHNEGVKIVRVPPIRPKWIQYQNVEDTIWDRDNLNDSVHTELVNSVNWI